MKRVRCAIYTRKSSEEGLEQEFNSLDAQREACEAYIKSQAELGWRVMRERFDDGGLSGGTLERPALQRLLAALEAHRVDIFVIYKIDRLTRSLTDFSRLAERFERLKVSFVSVTQQFNTATSMGRLMLNVLLSFAQFERELTGERIRDKIRASKQKGMWMGGFVPLGYDLADRALHVNPVEAKTVQNLYQRYLELGSVTALYNDAKATGLRTKACVRLDGTTYGNRNLSRGHLHRILSNPLYCGEIAHKGKCYPGRHQALVEKDLWDRVQASLEANRAGHRHRTTAKQTSLLAGLLYDESGDRYQPSHTRRRKKRYRYYVQNPPDDKEGSPEHSAQRLPADQIEKPVKNAILDLLESSQRMSEAFHDEPSAKTLKALLHAAKNLADRLKNADPQKWREAISGTLKKVILGAGALRLIFSRQGLRKSLGDNSTGDADTEWICEVQYELRNRGRQLRIVPIGQVRESQSRPNPALLKLIRRAHSWRQQLETSAPVSVADLARKNGVSSSYFTRVLRLAYLAPDIVEAVVCGRQPVDLMADQLVRMQDLPLDWPSQREYLGFPTA
ncbi:MAG: recombinase family protein [Deltaproteobacteria bacterium]|nr:recombinase family protein [Deltaproteobacteria bacterium]